MKKNPRHYSGTKPCLASGRCPHRFCLGNLFSQKQCKYVTNIEDAQGKDFLIYKTALFLRESALFRIMRMEEKIV